jgi:hypothetical protein
VNQVQNVQSTATGSSNLDLLFEAASIHSAAKEAYNRMESEVTKEAAMEAYNRMENEVIAEQAQNNASLYNNMRQYNQESYQRPHHQANSSIDSNFLPSEGVSRLVQGSQMRFSPIFCQPVQNGSMPSRGHSPSNNQSSHPGYHDRQPPTSFAPISSRGPTPTFHNYQAHPAYHNNDSRRDDLYQRSSQTYIPNRAAQQQPRYPRPPDVLPPYHQENYHMNNTQYHQQYQPRYNMHNGQQNGPHHQR